MNQIELHPYFQQTDLQRLHEGHGILTQAWSPIGGITSYRDAERSACEDPPLLEIAAIDALDTGVRGGPDPDTITLEGFGRKIPEA